MAPAPEPGGLADLLGREVRQLEAFVALLQREQTLLGDNAVDALPAMAEEKSAAAGTLAGLAQARDQELGRLGLPSGRAGMDAWSESPAGRAARPAWQRLLALAAEARNLNETNGQLIAIHLSSNQQALATLMAAVDQATTYGPDGQQKSGGGGRSLGSA